MDIKVQSLYNERKRTTATTEFVCTRAHLPRHLHAGDTVVVAFSFSHASHALRQLENIQ